MSDHVSLLEKRIGFGFPDRRLARQALTHKSWANEHKDQEIGDNERLEFLGDAVLDLAVSERLMALFPEAPEGVLSKLRASMVDEKTLSAIAREIDLGSLLLLGRGEEASGGRKKASLLADALEAVVASVYLQGGLPAASRLVDRLFSERFARAAVGPVDRDHKTKLQEEVQRRQLPLPVYRVVEERGPEHAKTFVVEVEVGDSRFRAEGRTKKHAEQLGAKAALGAISKWDEVP